MFITNEEFDVIKKAMMLLPQGKEFEALPTELQDVIIIADVTMMNLLEKKKRDNKRISEYVACKRKVNKNYAR